MGWDGIKLAPQQTAAAYVRQDIEAAGHAVRHVHATHDAVYLAVQIAADGGHDKAGDVVGLVVAVRYDRGFTWLKWMHEAEGPYYHAAPVSLLDALTPPRAGYALQWRDRCRDQAAKDAAYQEIVDAVA
jgi:hypothetical protein